MKRMTSGCGVGADGARTEALSDVQKRREALEQSPNGRYWRLVIRIAVDKPNLAVEKVVPLREYRAWVEGSLFRLVHCWCWCKYCQRYYPHHKDFSYWREELSHCVDNLKLLKIRTKTSKRAVLAKMVRQYDYDDPEQVFRCMDDGYYSLGNAKKMRGEAKKRSVAQDFANGVMDLIDAISLDSISTVGYLGATFGSAGMGRELINTEALGHRSLIVAD